MKIFSYFTATIIFVSLCSCTKDSGSGSANNGNVALLQKDPSVPDNFGMKINFSAFGLPKPNGGHIWIADNSFLIVAASDILKADFSTGELINIAPNSGGLILGLTGDNKGVLFAGDVNYVNGYYSYQIPSGPVESLISLSKSEAGSIIVYENNMLLHLGNVVTVGRPCTSPWDFWCGTSTTIVDAKLYYINKTTHTDSILGTDLYPVRFSEDGTKSLAGSISSGVGYIIDMGTLKAIDSIPSGIDHFLWENELQRISAETSNQSQIFITNAKTGEVLKSFQTETNLIGGSFFISDDGQMIAYTGPCIGTNDCTYAIWILDLEKNEQKKIVYTTSDSFFTSPFEEISVSPDHKKIVFRYVNDLYLREF